MSEIFDWQHEKVRDRLATRLRTDLKPWLDDHDLSSRLSADTIHKHLLAALDFVGERPDGYVMARFLEDNRSWPANQWLVAITSTAAKLRDRAIQELEDGARPKPKLVMPQLDKDGLYPPYTRFLFKGAVYVILGCDFFGYAIVRQEDLGKGPGVVLRSSRAATNDLVKEYYQSGRAAADDDLAF